MNDARQHDAIWLYRAGEDTHGPMAAAAIADKWVHGIIDAQTRVARLGTDFAPLGQVAAFAHVAPLAQAAARRRERRRFALWTALALAILAAAAAGTGWMLRRDVSARMAELRTAALRQQQANEEAIRAQAQARAEADRRGTLARAAAHDMPLVALVTLTALQDIKVEVAPNPDEHRHSRRHRHRRDAGDASDAAAADDSLVETCQLTPADVFATLRGQLAKLNVCIEDEKRRDTAKLLPHALKMQFTVRADGDVTEFAIDDRLFRSGPLNNCMVRAFKSIHFPSRQGAACPVTLPIKIRA